jgi:hypothetical protein
VIPTARSEGSARFLSGDGDGDAEKTPQRPNLGTSGGGELGGQRGEHEREPEEEASGKKALD